MSNDSLEKLRDAILRLVGCGSTLQGVGQEMPPTPLEASDTFCPEIFMCSIAMEITRQANIALSGLELLEADLDKADTIRSASKVAL